MAITEVLILADDMSDLPAEYYLLVIKNGNYTFLLLLVIMANEVADLLADLLSPLVLPSTDQECRLHINHIGRSNGRSTSPILPSSDQEWQLHISTVISHIGR